MSEEHLHAPTGAYALDALPPDEREAFERHLRECPACAQEVRGLTATAARLGTAVAAAPPPALRARVLDGIRTVRQLPPHVPPSVPGRAPGRRRALPRLVLAACVAAAAAFGGVAVWQYQEARQAEVRAEGAQRRAAELARVLAAPDARTATGTLGGGARATVVVSRAEDRAVFLASGLPELPEGRAYQLWFADGDRMRPAGLVRDDATVMDGRVAGATGMGVTVEPSGGSPRPTTEPLAVMTLPS
ncbi:anti-sigma factor [Streptomyces sp. DH12]|uniref:anti-sigma factor n=1 Tax=Streptomyces sp. DH12 TaxID=2857010 RepID=UPI001E3747AF|nr:anti-sigma factor [Streptomyces sp. DH12]